MRLDDGAADCQPHTHAPGFGRKERLKQFVDWL